MAIHCELLVSCDFCGVTGPALPVKMCPECGSHTCRQCGQHAASLAVPPASGFFQSIGRGIELQAGVCPNCMLRSIVLQPVVIRLSSW
jgi:hypothetical protein